MLRKLWRMLSNHRNSKKYHGILECLGTLGMLRSANAKNTSGAYVTNDAGPRGGWASGGYGPGGLGPRGARAPGG